MVCFSKVEVFRSGAHNQSCFACGNVHCARKALLCSLEMGNASSGSYAKGALVSTTWPKYREIYDGRYEGSEGDVTIFAYPVSSPVSPMLADVSNYVAEVRVLSENGSF